MKMIEKVAFAEMSDGLNDLFNTGMSSRDRRDLNQLGLVAAGGGGLGYLLSRLAKKRRIARDGENSNPGFVERNLGRGGIGLGLLGLGALGFANKDEIVSRLRMAATGRPSLHSVTSWYSGGGW